MKKPNHKDFNFEHGQTAYEIACEKYEAYKAAKKVKNVAYRAKRTAREQEALAKAKAATANRDIDPTREEWLSRAVKLVLPILAELGYAPTNPVKVAMGICFTGRRSAKKEKALGLCYNAENSAGEFREIFIDPSITDSRKLLGVLTHELGHACLKSGVGHRAPFKKFCEAVGFEFEKCAFADDGASFWNWAKQIVAELGPIPHKALNTDHAEGEKKKQPTRMLLLECPCCEIKLRTAKKTLEQIMATSGYVARCINPSCEGEIDIQELLSSLDGESEEE